MDSLTKMCFFFYSLFSKCSLLHLPTFKCW